MIYVHAGTADMEFPNKYRIPYYWKLSFHEVNALIYSTLISIIVGPNCRYTLKGKSIVLSGRFSAGIMDKPEVVRFLRPYVNLHFGSLSVKINLLLLSQQTLFLCVSRANFPHFEISAPFRVHFLHWELIFPLIRVNFQHLD